MATRILNFGSLNIDHVYLVDHFVRPGETLGSKSYRVFMGGKGSNQSVALARAGASVAHAGKIGTDGKWIKDRLRSFGVDTSFLDVSSRPSGHAIIQINRHGENAIILSAGANHAITAQDAWQVLHHFRRGDYLLLQNEISAMPTIMRLAAKKGLKIVFNPSPMQPKVFTYPLRLVDIFIINEIEGWQLTGRKQPAQIAAAMRRRFPRAAMALTLGARGVLYADRDGVFRIPALKVKVVDTTAAGDTFTGYFLAELIRGAPVKVAIELANKAAAICVTRAGAADSIPKRQEVIKKLKI
jgi:ribokinase